MLPTRRSLRRLRLDPNSEQSSRDGFDPSFEGEDLGLEFKVLNVDPRQALAAAPCRIAEQPDLFLEGTNARLQCGVLGVQAAPLRARLPEPCLHLTQIRLHFRKQLGVFHGNVGLGTGSGRGWANFCSNMVTLAFNWSFSSTEFCRT